MPVATLAGGSGSIQVTGLGSFFSFDAPLNKGTATVKESGVVAWQNQVAKDFALGASASAACSGRQRTQLEGRTSPDAKRVSSSSARKLSCMWGTRVW